MKVGICNEMSGGSNAELFESKSAVIADLQSGTGGKNSLDIRFVPSWGLNFDLSGNNHCIAGPAGTIVKHYDANDNGHKVYLDAPAGDSNPLFLGPIKTCLSP